jgi:hypothetical protein
VFPCPGGREAGDCLELLRRARLSALPLTATQLAAVTGATASTVSLARDLLDWLLVDGAGWAFLDLSHQITRTALAPILN